MSGIEATTWWKSSRSPLSDDCVEIALLGDAVGIRDSKNPDRVVLVVSRDSWRGFVAGVRGGEFDR